MKPDNRNTLQPRVIKLKGLIIGYTGLPELTKSIDAEFEGPGIHALVGGNGSGKSTLLRTILGLQAALKGQVLFDGRNVDSFSYVDRASMISFVESTPPRTSGLKVAEVLDLARGLTTKHETNIHETWGLDELLMRRLDTLSDGQAQRVMFARAASQGASWMFLDEPTAFLDIPARRELIEMLTKFAATNSVIITTHDLHALRDLKPKKVLQVYQEGLKTLETNSEDVITSWEKALS